ncbi:MAG: 1,4-alpha-glucan branching protein GlgB [Eubacteriales bacterium]|nr:1,4-alpha-glucan branching protein GlgB [Eubacteriales bacterium]
MSDYGYGLGEFPLYLFNEGTNYKAYEALGVHRYNNGWRFAVWAPNAKHVAVACDHNLWTGDGMELKKAGSTGIWYGWFDDVKEGELYKYAVLEKSGKITLKADPFAFEAELRPNSASVVRDVPEYKWTDKKWLSLREKTRPYDKPMLIYEVHPGSWRVHDDGSFLSYRELADELIPYIKDMGYTHIEFMPLSEYPFDGSWGYQVTGYFAATKRYGSPEDLMYFIDIAHKNGIYVIMDWVPAHFPRDGYGLYMFDGSATFEYADPRMGEHKDWGTMVFDYSKGEVNSFLLSSAYFWAEVYHIDGLRVDAVSSMLYRDYSRNDGEWIANIYGGNENIEAINFLRNLNKTMFASFPNFLMIAEESTAWGMVTGDVEKGGLGFNYKWNMGWMNDTLRYMSMDPYFRKSNHNLLTFLMFYAYSENYILPLSHDEVVHGKHSLVDKMYGSYEEKFASYRALLAYYLSLPGKKLMFMGGEIAQFIEWRYDEGLEWKLLDFEMHKKLQDYVRDINRFYVNNKAFWQIDDCWDGFAWINDQDGDNSVISYMRKGKRKGDNVIVCVNFTPVDRPQYRIGVPSSGEYEIVMNSAEKKYGGESRHIKTSFKAKKVPVLDMSYSIEVPLDGYAALYIRKKPSAKKNTASKKDSDKVRREKK